MISTDTNEGLIETPVGSDLANLADSLSGAAFAQPKPAAKTRGGAAIPASPARPECRPVAAGGMFAALHPDCSQEYLERFQLLRAQLMLHRTQVAPEVDFHSVAVMSTSRGEGKSFTATNLASILAASSTQGVLLIDGNPEGAELPLGVDALKPGLSHALTEPDKWAQSVYSVKDSTLSVMPRGRGSARSMTFNQLPRLLALLRRRFEWVVLDGTSFHSAPEAEWISSVTDGTLLVTQGGSVKFEAFQHSLVRVPERRLVGVVFNERKQPSAAFRVRLRFSGRWMPGRNTPGRA